MSVLAPRNSEELSRVASAMQLEATRESTPMALDDTFQNLSEFINGLDEEGQTRFEMSHSMVIICPDCGKNVAFRNRCPKCGGNSWIPAGHAGGIFEQMKAERALRRMRAPDDELDESSVEVRG